MASDTMRQVCRLNFKTLTYTPITTIEDLQRHVQGAIQVELATIPIYLTALFSMKKVDSEAYRLTRSVAMEEMLHVYQASGLLISIGGTPILTGDAVPTYPSYLPGSSKEDMPYLALRRASPEVFRNMFMVIEKPATFTAPPQDTHYETIGQYYKALLIGLENCVEKFGEKAVFQQNPELEQWQNFYFGKFGGRFIPVSNLKSAKLAIRQIVQQGEGAITANRELVPNEPWSAYDHYGERVDGTYGPILGKPHEMSHYFKFKKIADGDVPFPDTYPIVGVPDIANYESLAAKNFAQVFNILYSTLLRSLEQAFHSGQANYDLYFTVSVRLMHQLIPQIGQQLMNIPIWSDGNPSYGPNAAPTFEYTQATLADAVKLMNDIQKNQYATDIAELEKCCKSSGMNF